MAPRSVTWRAVASMFALSWMPPVSAQSQGTFYAAFEDGLEAERLGHWKAALVAFQRAAELRPTPAAAVFTYGNNRLHAYYPYAHMARCALELGDRNAAASHLKQSEARGEPASLREPLARRIQDAEPKPATPLALPVESKPTVLPPAEIKLPGPIHAQPPPPLELPMKAVPELAKPPVLVPPVNSAPSAASSPAPSPAPSPMAAPEPTHPGPDQAPSRAPEAAATKPLPTWTWSLPPILLFGIAGGVLLWRRKASVVGKSPSFQIHPTVLGPYLIERVLGRGGFANTYLARHRETGEPVALKVLHAHRWDDEDMLLRFRQEAKVGAMLQHPNIVPIIEASPGGGSTGEPPWIAMAYVEGETLEAHMMSQGALPIAESVDIALDLAEALTHAHTFGIVHRDLKPGNVMLQRGRAMVMDLGIARVLDSATVTTTYSFLGTPLYAAPEAQKRSHVGPAADRYSLGVMLFEMLSGAPPFSGETPFEILDRHRAHPLPELRFLRKDAPPALVRLVERLAQKDPDLRPEDLEVVKILKALKD